MSDDDSSMPSESTFTLHRAGSRAGDDPALRLARAEKRAADLETVLAACERHVAFSAIAGTKASLGSVEALQAHERHAQQTLAKLRDLLRDKG
jgi:hypothetical protein